MTSTDTRPSEPALHGGPVLSRSPDLDTLLDQMTLEEQVSLLAGADHWCTTPVPRLKIPSLKVTDGPSGARGVGTLVGSKPTAAFPVGIALGSTWNKALLREIGVHLARETLDKGAAVLLAPTMNLFRSALNGRNFESYSEDPYLTGALGVAYVQGLQSSGVAATVKHFVGNESEFERSTISSDIPERALRELYLRPFEMAVREGGAWAVMTGYNRLNGTYCSQSPRLLGDILRDEWGFSGLVMSDWGGTHSAGASVRAGLDLEMPGPAKARATLLAEALKDEETRKAVRVAAKNVLRLIERTGTLTRPLDVSGEAERATEYPDTRSLIRRAGAEGAVLLKNNAVCGAPLLPLPAGVTVAVIGPNAAVAQVMGGGSSQLNAHRRVSPLEGLRDALGEANVSHAVGTFNNRYLPILQTPIHIEYLGQEGEVLATEIRLGSEVMWGILPAGIAADSFRARLTLTLIVPEEGTYDLSLFSAGLSRLSVQGKEVIDNWTTWQPGETYFGFGSDEIRERVSLDSGTHDVVVEFTPKVHDNGIAAFSAVRIGFQQPSPPTDFEDAVKLAGQADYAVVCVGTNSDWETEGIDRQGLTLPGDQDALVSAVLSANPRTVVLLQTGGPVLMPWLDDAPAVLQGWFPGQEAGHALADVLLGHVDPGGRLPQTFPARLSDDPTHPELPDVQYPGSAGHVEYQEGLYIGYRHVDRHALTPLFPFGHGLSYTTFSLGEVQVSTHEFRLDEALQVTVPVTNTGVRAGQTVIQLYVSSPDSRMARPWKELQAFEKVSLNPGETQDVLLELNFRSFAYFDDIQNVWVADPGEIHLLIGESSADARKLVTIRIMTQI